MSEADRHMFRIRLSGVIQDDKRAQVGLRHGLGLDEQEIDKLPQALPLEWVVMPQSEAERQRMIGHLESSGLQVDVSEASVRFGACERHHKLAASESCPRCKERTCPCCLRLHSRALCSRCQNKHRRRASFRRLRIGVLLGVLLVVAFTAYDRNRRIASWTAPLRVVIHPAQDKGSAPAQPGLAEQHIEPLEAFFRREGGRYHLESEPFEFVVGKPLTVAPPSPPSEVNVSSAIVYSLQLRWWSWRQESSADLQEADVRVYALFHSVDTEGALEHSFGLEKAGIGVVHIFESEKLVRRNAVVFAHEVLHTVGAVDKYDAFGNPSFPHGFANPLQQPTFPQTHAEIMGGSVAIAPGKSKLPAGLEGCVIGGRTSTEIGWTNEI